MMYLKVSIEGLLDFFDGSVEEDLSATGGEGTVGDGQGHGTVALLEMV